MGTHPIFESDFDCLTVQTMMSGLSGSEYSLISSSEPDTESIECMGLECTGPEENSTPKCPVCLVSPYTYVKTKCNHNFCLTCVIKMWESENSNIEDDEEWGPILCPMCRDLVTVLTWSPSDTILPHEIHDYNRLYRNYRHSTRRSTSQSRSFMAVTFLVYLLIFLQLAPFLSPLVGFLYPRQTARAPRLSKEKLTRNRAFSTIGSFFTIKFILIGTFGESVFVENAF